MAFKIAYVIGQLGIGGTERQLLELVRGLNRTQFEPQVFCLSGSAPLKTEFEMASCPVFLLGRETRGRTGTVAQLYRLLKANRPHLVHVFAYASRAAMPVVRILGNTKVVVSLRTDPAWQVTWIDKVVNNYSDIITTNSHVALEKIVRFWPRVPHLVIYNGINMENFTKKESRNSLPVNNEKILGVVARAVSVKGLDVLLKAFLQVHKVLPDVCLWMIGDGPLRNSLEMKTQQLGLGDKVVFWGERKDIPDMLAHCDIGVLPSFWEGLPNAVLEYMAAGLPVVATQVGGIPEIVVEGETGLLVPPGDEQALADALLSLLNNPERAQQMGQAGRLRVEQYFSLERMIKEHEKLYLNLMGGR